jgi:hypothetical protein
VDVLKAVRIGRSVSGPTRGDYTHRSLRIRTGRSVDLSVELRMLRGRPRAYAAAMQSSERDRGAAADPVDEPTEEGPALRDAGAVAARVATDEALARAARDLYLVSPVPVLDADERVTPHLLPGEQVHGLRRHAILRAPGDDRSLGYGGSLYLTSRRLMHLGQVFVTVQLTDIVETSLAGERLLLSLRGGEGLSLDIERPRLLRAEMAALTRELRV